MKLNTVASANHRDWGHIVDLVIQKSKAGLRAEASRGYLGVLWWVLEPLLYMSIFYVIFVHLFHRGDENFIMFLLTGLIVWKWFATTVMNGANSLMANSSLMNQVYLPKIIFPLTAVVTNTFKFFLILSLFLVFLQFTSIQVSWTWLLLPLLVLTQLLLMIGLCSLLAAIMPFFPDLQAILQNIMMMMLFLSGVFFDIGRLPAPVQSYFRLNPMATLIAMYRKLLLDGVAPDFKQLFWIVLFSLMVLALSLMLLRRFDRVYPKIIL